MRAPKPTGGTTAPWPARALGRRGAIRTGVLTNLLNPKVTLSFLALFTQISRPATPLPAQVVYGLTMVGSSSGGSPASPC